MDRLSWVVVPVCVKHLAGGAGESGALRVGLQLHPVNLNTLNRRPRTRHGPCARPSWAGRETLMENVLILSFAVCLINVFTLCFVRVTFIFVLLS